MYKFHEIKSINGYDKTRQFEKYNNQSTIALVFLSPPKKKIIDIPFSGDITYKIDPTAIKILKNNMRLQNK